MNYVNKLLTALGENTKLEIDKWSNQKKFEAGLKKWIANITPV